MAMALYTLEGKFGFEASVFNWPVYLACFTAGEFDVPEDWKGNMGGGPKTREEVNRLLEAFKKGYRILRDTDVTLDPDNIGNKLLRALAGYSIDAVSIGRVRHDDFVTFLENCGEGFRIC